jgi:hypothetical protein
MFGLFLAAFSLLTLVIVLSYLVFQRYEEKLHQLASLIPGEDITIKTNNRIVIQNVSSFRSVEPSHSVDQDSADKIQSERKDIGSTKYPLKSILTSINAERKTQNKWQCACEGGIFLPNSILKSFSGAEAVFKMGSGQCYHKKI